MTFFSGASFENQVYHVTSKSPPAGALSPSGGGGGGHHYASAAAAAGGKGPFGLMGTVREKLDNVRGRRRSKEPSGNEAKKGYNTDGDIMDNDDYSGVVDLEESAMTTCV